MMKMMKKISSLLLALLLVLSLAACADKTTPSTESSANSNSNPSGKVLVVTVNIEGLGEIAYAKGDAAPKFDDEFPSQSAYIGLAGPETYTFAARPSEGYKLACWMRNGEEFSTEDTITLEISEDTDLVAIFLIAGTDDTPVDLNAVQTIGELLGKPNYGTSTTDDKFILAFEQDRMIYRAIADLPSDVSDAIFALDWEDPEYDEKRDALIAPLKIISITNLTESIPSQEELDQLVGKTGAELLNDGWYYTGWNTSDGGPVFSMNKGPYAFNLVMAGDIANLDDFEEEDLRALVVESVTFDLISDPTFFDEA